LHRDGTEGLDSEEEEAVQAITLPGGQVATPTVKLSVADFSLDMRVFHVTLPPVLGSGKPSGGMLAIRAGCRTKGLMGRFEVVERIVVYFV
jgi:hypothetical protein